MKHINQGDIYLADLNPVKGHEQAGLRPVLIVQNNFLNKNLNTVIIAPITSNLKAKDYLTTYFLNKQISYLNMDSVILLYQLRTIDKIRLTKELSHLPYDIVAKIKLQMELVF